MSAFLRHVVSVSNPPGSGSSAQQTVQPDRRERRGSGL